MSQKREHAYSTAQSYPVGGGNLVFDLLFLRRLADKYGPGAKLVSLELKCKMVIDTGTAGGRGAALLGGALTRVQFKDAHGPRTLCSGHSIMVKNEEEIAGYRLPNNIAASQTNDTQFHYLDLHPTELQSEVFEDDHSILLSDIGETGSVELTLASPAALYTDGPTWKTTSSFQLVAEVEAGNPGDQFPRTVIMDYPVTVSPIATRFNVKGKLRSLIFDSGQSVETAGTALAEQNFQAPDLQYGQGLPISYLNHKYERRGRARARDAAGTINSDDHFVRNQCVSLWGPNKGQKVTEMPDLDTVGIQNDGTVPTTNSAIIVTSVVKRPADAVAASLKSRNGQTPSVDQARALYVSHGVIAGTNRPASSTPDARYLPLRVRR